MNVTATEAENRLGQVLEQAQIAPVFIENEKVGRPHSVVMSVDRYDALIRGQKSGAITTGAQFYERLSRVGAGHAVVSHRPVPSFVISGERLSLLAHAAAGIDARLLRSPVASLAAHAGEISDAVDAVVSGI